MGYLYICSYISYYFITVWTGLGIDCIGWLLKLKTDNHFPLSLTPSNKVLSKYITYLIWSGGVEWDSGNDAGRELEDIDFWSWDSVSVLWAVRSATATLVVKLWWWGMGWGGQMAILWMHSFIHQYWDSIFIHAFISISHSHHIQKSIDLFVAFAYAQMHIIFNLRSFIFLFLLNICWRLTDFCASIRGFSTIASSNLRSVLTNSDCTGRKPSLSENFSCIL